MAWLGQGDDGIVVLLTDHPGDDTAAQARHAVALCPGRALSIERTDHPIATGGVNPAGVAG